MKYLLNQNTQMTSCQQMHGTKGNKKEQKKEKESKN